MLSRYLKILTIRRFYGSLFIRYERVLCSMRAAVASKVLGWTDRYFVQAGLYRKLLLCTAQ